PWARKWPTAPVIMRMPVKTALVLFASAAALASPALAQDDPHAGHHQAATPPGAAAMDHSAHSSGHSGHRESNADHGETRWPVEGSGTSRLPAAEGMMPGLHFGLGDGWQGMAHGYAWGVYTDQGGPRGDDKLYVQSMAMLMAEKDFGGARLQLRTMLSA